jgi:glycosyltransferase involved in cell wall biosynthesis
MRILFTGKDHRVIRKETILNPPKGVEFVTLQPLDNMKKDHQLTNAKLKLTEKIGRYRKFFRENNLIPKYKLKNIDLIYSPGHLVLNKFPFVVEIDNVAVLAYYNIRLLKLLKKYIKNKLKSKYCKSIICISQAAKNSVVNYFNDTEIENKCVVVYPFSDYPKIKNKKSNKTKFLFISSNFYLKGGKEVVNAFLKIDSEKEFRNKLSLTIVTKIKDIDKDLLKKINKNKNINLIEANLNKDDLFNKYYSRADVFVLPTYQDSFGSVYLEALSASLPIIATNTFAIPEMVEDGKNGYLGTPPLNTFNPDFTPNKKWWYKDKVKYAKTHKLEEIEIFLIKKMKLFATNKELIYSMSIHSNKIYKEKFNENIRKKTLLNSLIKK